MFLSQIAQTSEDVSTCAGEVAAWKAAFVAVSCFAILHIVIHICMLMRRRWIRLRLMGVIILGCFAGPSVVLVIDSLGVELQVNVLAWSTACVLIAALACLCYLEREVLRTESAEQLYDDTQAVFRLYFLEGKTLSQIAAIMRVSRSRVCAIFRNILIIEASIKDDAAWPE